MKEELACRRVGVALIDDSRKNVIIDIKNVDVNDLYKVIIISVDDLRHLLKGEFEWANIYLKEKEK